MRVSGSTALSMGVCVSALMAAVPSEAQTRAFDIPAGDLASALDAFSRQSHVPVIYKADEMRDRRSPGYRGTAPIRIALDAILAGTGVATKIDGTGAVAIVVPDDASASLQDGTGDQALQADNDEVDRRAGAIPDILVTGKRDWTLDTDIRRTRDDAQPYIVFDAKQIRESGATNLDDFFRDNLAAANGAGTARQNPNGAPTSINLRGLGSDETMILIDGRRTSTVNRNNGLVNQSPIDGIPLASIERIEVLASSASGIYGGNATGGVINIILKRDYRGLELSATFGDRFGGNARNGRVDLAAGTNLEGGRTNIMLTGSWQHDDPFLAGDTDVVRRGRRIRQSVDPNALLGTMPIGATPNIRSTTYVGGVLQNLTLKPAYGGTALGSVVTSVPYGYRGIDVDGGAPLAARAGTFNFDLPAIANYSAYGPGADYALLQGIERASGSLAVRRELNSWLKVYAEAAGSWTSSEIITSLAGQINLAATSPLNPFQQGITVSYPLYGADQSLPTTTYSVRAVGGVIVSLPYEWKATADYSWNHSWYRYAALRSFDAATQLATTTGTGAFNPLRDSINAPPTYGYLSIPGGQSPSQSTTQSASVRFAGPVPVSLPGGRPTMTVQFQRNRTDLDTSVTVINTTNAGQVYFNPPADQTIDSIYGELRLPILGNGRTLPLFQELELQVAGRQEWYRQGAGLNKIYCYRLTGPLPDNALETPCPAPGQSVPRAQSRYGSFNPTFAVRWRPVRDVILRGSYATGYNPPPLNNLVTTANNQVVYVTDPKRGNEAIGALQGASRFLPITTGGNSSIRPELSKSYSAGIVVTPRFVPGLRVSVDWTRIEKKDNFYSPFILLYGNLISASGQADFNAFLNAHPERFVRSGDPGAYGVAPITGADVSAINLSGSRIQAIDFAASYDRKLGRGSIQADASATYAYDLAVQLTAADAYTQYAGVATAAFAQGDGGADAGSVKWKGTLTVKYVMSDWSLGARTRYVGSYYALVSHAVDPQQGSATIPAQAYLDLFGSYAFSKKWDMRVGFNNVLNKLPPYVAQTPTLYSLFGDPRGAYYYVRIGHKF